MLHDLEPNGHIFEMGAAGRGDIVIPKDRIHFISFFEANLQYMLPTTVKDCMRVVYMDEGSRYGHHELLQGKRSIHLRPLEGKYRWLKKKE